MSARRIAEVAALLAAVAVAAPPVPAQDDPSTLIAPPVAHTFGVRRATARELSLLMPGIELVDPGGIAVARLAATDDPKSKDDDDEITIVAVDTGAGVVFASFGRMRIASWSGEGSAVGPLSRPTDIALDRDGLVAITDTGNRRVVILRHDGGQLEERAAHGGFVDPRGITADGAGGFLVCDRGRNAIIRLDAMTGAKKTFGLEAAFDRPVDVVTIPEGDRLAKGKKRVVAVADLDGARLRTFDPAGAVRASRAASTLGVPGASFDAIELDWHGNVFAVDRGGNRIHKLRDDLVPLATWGSRGTDAGRFVSPRGIAIHRRFGQVFITEADGGQYLWVATDVNDLRATAGSPARIHYFLTEESLVDVRILDAAGREVAQLVEGARQPAGPQSGTWDGTRPGGARAGPGEYRVEVRARATYASRSHFECRRSAVLKVAR